MTSQSQAGILAAVPLHARYLTFRLAPSTTREAVVHALSGLSSDAACVVGLGSPTLALLDVAIPGMRPFPHLVGRGVEMPGTAGALWCWLRGDDRGDLLHRGRSIASDLAGAFVLDEVTDGFRYGVGLDLSGYVDGTENPEGERAVEVAFVSGAGPGLDGASYVAVQKWHHDLSKFLEMTPAEQDATFGRSKSDNEEMDDAPESAHVKRTAQEDFDPEAFVVRRSMPWAEGAQEGLVFVAFGRSLDPYEAIARRMLGLDDGVVDALFRFTHPASGSYYWCPPVKEGKLDLRAIREPESSA